jgi:hypothetical protein
VSRCTDNQSEVQPSVAELYENWGITGEEAKKAVRTTHFTAMQPWRWPAMEVCTMRCSLN